MKNHNSFLHLTLLNRILKNIWPKINIFCLFNNPFFTELLWKDSIEKLYQFLDDINKIHPTIKFTLEHSSPFYCGLKDAHDCWCHGTKSIPFLDTKLYIEDGKITTDLYRKPTDRCMYLLPSSCHPAHISI